MSNRIKNEILDLIKKSLSDYKDKELIRMQATIIGNLLEKKRLFDFGAKLDNLHYDFYPKSNNYLILNSVLKKIKYSYNLDKLIFRDILNELNQYFKELKIKNPIKKYVLVFPINLIFKNSVLNDFIIYKKDVKIKLEDYNYFIKNFELKINKFQEEKYNIYQHKNEINMIKAIKNSNYMYFVVELHARNAYYASKKAFKNISLNMGIYTFIKYAYKSFIKLGGNPFEKKISKIDTPLVFIFKESELETILFSTYIIPIRSEKMSSKEITLIKSIKDSIMNIKHMKLSNIAKESFGKYFIAITDSNISSTFLKFWNILEFLLLKNAEMSEKQMIKRLKSMYREDLETKNEEWMMIDYLYNKRNLFVHESLDTINEDDRNFIKEKVDFLIEYFMILAKEMENVGMIEFLYDNIRKPLRIIEEELNVLSYIKNEKKNKISLNTQ